MTDTSTTIEDPAHAPRHLFVIGGQRCGSTYLHELLAAHPEIAMAQPVRPEPKVFLDPERVALGRDHYLATYFPHRGESTSYLGEKSTTYIESRAAAERIAAFAPDARILVILREPALRAWSNHRFSTEHGVETLSFDDALAAEDERLVSASFTTSTNPFAYRRRGHYMDYLEQYLEVFDPAQVKVLVFEELVGSAEGVRDLYRWLGIDEDVRPASLDRVVNASSAPKVEPPVVALHELAAGYEESVARLERHLGRSIDVWRERWARYAQQAEQLGAPAR